MVSCLILEAVVAGADFHRPVTALAVAGASVVDRVVVADIPDSQGMAAEADTQGSTLIGGCWGG